MQEKKETIQGLGMLELATESRALLAVAVDLANGTGSRIVNERLLSISMRLLYNDLNQTKHPNEHCVVKWLLYGGIGAGWMKIPS